MPFYEYECAGCGHQLEAMQKISDAPLRKCPECGKSKLTKLISAPIFRLKGGGWYETDFKSESDKKRNLHGDSEGAGASSSNGESTSSESKKDDAKPAETAAAKPADKPAESKPKKPAAKKAAGAKAGAAKAPKKRAAASR